MIQFLQLPAWVKDTRHLSLKCFICKGRFHLTLIECFTSSHIDNIAACLCIQPNRMVMVGNAADMREPIQRYQKLLKQRNIATEVAVCDVQRMDLGDITAMIQKVVLDAKDCIIDLTGGDAWVIMAVGAVWAKLPVYMRQRIRVVNFDHKIGLVRDCINDNQTIPTETVNLTVEELIALHGGTLYPTTYQHPASSPFPELDRLWQIVSQSPKDWNRDIALLSEFESRSDSKTQVFLPLRYLRNSITNFEAKEHLVRALLGKLHQNNIINDQSSHSSLEYTYNSPMLRYCTLKAGNVLEVKTLLEGRAVTENNTPYFHDCQMSVIIDWDGVVHDPAEQVSETRNEIDIMLMHGTTPLFISCKNGSIGDDELYKLNTVAERFGGHYARKMLIATNLDQKGLAANRAFIQRAWDMDIFLVTDAATLSKSEWHDIFKIAMQ